MLSLWASLSLVVAGALGHSPTPSSTSLKTKTVVTRQQGSLAGCQTPAVLDPKTNIWKNFTLHPNSHYRKQVEAAAALIADPVLRRQASQVADIGTFLWIESTDDITQIEPATTEVPCGHILGIVLFGLQEHKCINRTPPNATELQAYQTRFVDPITQIIKAHPNTAFAIILEPETLGSLVANANLTACRQATVSNRQNMASLLRKLNDLPNVVMYLDVGHGGSLGWIGNAQAGAAEVARIFETAGRPERLRGYATNVGNWNGWDLMPPEWDDCLRSEPAIRLNKGRNEKLFAQYFASALKSVPSNLTATTGAGGPLPSRFILDASRNGVQGLRRAWSEWCNVRGAGLGRRPTANTGYEELMDAFVWARPPGLSDGTSDPQDMEYDSFCGVETAFKPAPRRGEWCQGCFEHLVVNAYPPLKGGRKREEIGKGMVVRGEMCDRQAGR